MTVHHILTKELPALPRHTPKNRTHLSPRCTESIHPIHLYMQSTVLTSLVCLKGPLQDTGSIAGCTLAGLAGQTSNVTYWGQGHLRGTKLMLSCPKSSMKKQLRSAQDNLLCPSSEAHCQNTAFQCMHAPLQKQPWIPPPLTHPPHSASQLLPCFITKWKERKFARITMSRKPQWHLSHSGRNKARKGWKEMLQ